jgi:hypothetical protein
MPKKSRASSSGRRGASAPPPFFPVATSVPREEFKIDDVQFTQLEKSGNIKLSESQRAKLLTLAEFWIDDFRVRHTARPKQFAQRFDKMITAFAQAEEACQLNERVGSLDRHLFHWPIETPVKDANLFLDALAALEFQLKSAREKVVALKDRLPPDPGRQRPFDDERRIIFLADIFQEAGGKPKAYLSEYVQLGSMADTPFRAFAQYFYALLPAVDKRDPGGFDKALRLALKTRRAQRRTRSR